MSSDHDKPLKQENIDADSLNDSVTQVEDLTGILRQSLDKKTIFMIILAFSWMILFFVIGNQDEGGIGGILEQLSHVRIELVVLAVLITLLGLCLDAFAWRVLLKSMDVSASINDALETYFVSFAWGLLVPSLTAAEIYVRISLGKKRFVKKLENRSPSSGELFSTIVLHKLLGFLVFIPLSVLVAYGLVVLLDLDATAGFVFLGFVATLTVFVIVFLGLVYKKPNIAISLLTRLISAAAALIPPYKSKADSHKAAARQFVNDYTLNLQLLASHPRQASQAYLLAMLNVICGLSGATILVYAAGGNVPIWAILVIMFVSGTLNLIPLGIPGMEGIKETVITPLYQRYETFSKSGAIALLNSLNTLYMPVLVGLVVQLFVTQKKDKAILENQ
ncbi:MAG: lysylphosphatidylglycerol synthase transmembrane domain-containing protein [Candidatus Heimdallarchaeota archaeon]